MTVTSRLASQVQISGSEVIKGRFASFNLRSTSYYPVEKAERRIALALYGIDLQHQGLLESKKYREELEAHESVTPSTPFVGASRSEGSFFLFLPEGETAWGLLDIRRVVSHHPRVNLSLVSPLALMPYRLHVVGGGIYSHKSQFYVIDEEGSQWTLHCDTLK